MAFPPETPGVEPDEFACALFGAGEIACLRASSSDRGTPVRSTTLQLGSGIESSIELRPAKRPEAGRHATACGWLPRFGSVGLVLLGATLGLPDRADGGRGDPFKIEFDFIPSNPSVGEQVSFAADVGLARSGMHRWEFARCATTEGPCDVVHTDEGRNVSFAFNEPGYWEVTLLVGLTKTRVGSTSRLIDVAPAAAQGLVANFQVLRLAEVDPHTGEETWEPVGLSEDDPIGYGERVVLASTSAGAAYYRWREDGKLISTSSSEARTYSGPTSVGVSLTVYNADASESDAVTKTVYVADGVEVLDFLPTVARQTRSMAVDGNIAWVIRMTDELAAIDVSDPSNLRYIVGGVFPASSGWNVAAAEQRVLVARGPAGLDIYTNPLNPVLRSVFTYDTNALDGQQVYDVKAIGKLAFLAAGPAGLKVLDVSLPTAPRLLGQAVIPNGHTARWLALGGGVAFVADEVGGVHVVDVSRFNPAFPQAGPIFVSSTVMASAVVDRITANETGLVACVTALGVNLFQVVSPADVRPTATIDGRAFAGRQPSGIVLGDSTLHMAFAYASLWPFELYVFDVVDPYSPYSLVSISNTNTVGGVIGTGVRANGAVIWASAFHDLFSTTDLGR
ncbi:MAG: hypothetical protein J5J06_05350 [Phycisphaerae bacterium]|nr:hypothetical protein [Phycisphaerae bacterium]